MLFSTFHNNMFENFKFTPNGLTATNCNLYNYKICPNLRIESDNVYSIEPMSETTSKYAHQYDKDRVKLIFKPSIKFSEKNISST